MIKRVNKGNISLYLLLFLSFFSNATLRSEDNLIIYMFISLFIFIWVYFRALRQPKSIFASFFTGFTAWLFVLFSIYFCYGLFLTSYDYFNARYFLFILVSTYIILVLFIRVPKDKIIDIFIKVCSVTIIAMSLFILLNEWSLIISGSTRIGESASGNVNTVAIYLGTLSIPVLYKIIFENKYIYIFPYASSLVITLLTGSKKGIIFLLFGLILFLIMKYKIKAYKYLPYLLIMGIAVVFLFNNTYLYNIIGYRIIDFLGTLGFNIEGANYSDSTAKRMLFIEMGYNFFINNPIFGNGWGYFTSKIGTYSHNNFVELLVTYGLFGFVIYYSMFIYLLIKLIKMSSYDNDAKLFITIILTILINDIAVVSFSYNVMNYQILAITYIFANSSRQKSLGFKMGNG